MPKLFSIENTKIDLKIEFILVYYSNDSKITN